MHIDVLTLFPDMLTGVLNSSILKRAREKELFTYYLINFRHFSTNKHKKVDDYPYGGGEGMVLTVQPIYDALEHIKTQHQSVPRVLLMCPQGETYTQQKAEELVKEEHLVIICGHYEGYDERIRTHLVTDEISIGVYVLTNGEIGACVVIDSIVRLLPGVLGNRQSTENESFSSGLLDYPHYTRPQSFKEMDVPEVLLQGHHAEIERWRMQQALKRTYERRPDLLEKITLTEEQKTLLKQIRNNNE